MAKMKAKKLMVFFLAFASILLVANSVIASGFDSDSEDIPSSSGSLAVINAIQIDDVYAFGNEVAVEAGSVITIKVYFTALVNAADVRVKAELEGDKVDESATTSSFNVEKGKRYSKTLTLEVPRELQDEVSSDVTLALKIWNGDYRTISDKISLRVQRPSYSASIMSIDSASSVKAGKVYPVDIVLKNDGYNKLDNVYVTLKIAELGVERTSYFGDLVPIETNDNSDYTTKRFLLEIPYNAKAGSYLLEVEAKNSDFKAKASKEIKVINEFTAGSVIINKATQAASVNGKVDFEVVIANPTSDLRVFRVVTESNSGITTSSSAQLVAIPAGMTKSIVVTAKPHSKGEHLFDVSVFAGEELIESKKLTVLADGRTSSGSASGSSVVALTIILAIIFLVLLGALYALLKKKPGQSEEFGESYY